MKRLKAREDYTVEITVWKILSYVSMGLLLINIIAQAINHGFNVYRDVSGKSFLFAALHTLHILIETFHLLMSIDLCTNWAFPESSEKLKIDILIGYISFGVCTAIVIISVIVLVGQEHRDPAMPGDVKTVCTSLIANYFFYTFLAVCTMVTAYYIKAKFGQKW